MRNIALKLMYNGTAYHGWQVQKNAVTVCETLQKAVGEDHRRAGAPHRLRPDGRRGSRGAVHRQLPHGEPHPAGPAALCRQHPHAGGHRGAARRCEVAEDFNAIGSCLKKEYTYRILQLPGEESVLCQPGVFLPQASGRGISEPGGPSVCGDPRFRGGALRGHGDKDHRPHHLLVRRDPQRGSAGTEGLRRRLPL